MTTLVEQPTRDRTMAALFVTAALMNAAMAAASPISTIVAVTGSLASGLVLATGGYALLAGAAGAIVVLPTAVLLHRR